MRAFLPHIAGLSLCALLALAPSQASAACEAMYSDDALLVDIQTMAGALREHDAAALKGTGDAMKAGLGCMRAPMPPALFATVYRMLGVSEFENGNAEEAHKWFLSASELDPTHEWDIQDVAPGSPLFDAYDKARAQSGASPVAVEGLELNAPAGSTLYIDGRPLDAAEATLGRYHLLQQVSNGQVRASWLIEGNAFPEKLLREPTLSRNEEKAAEDAERDAQKRGRKEAEVLAGGYTTDEVVAVKRETPKAKVPLIAAGAVGLLAAGGVYGASYMTAQQFEQAATTDEVLAVQQLTNTLVIASGGVLLAGAGVGVWGILIDDSAPQPPVSSDW